MSRISRIEMYHVCVPTPAPFYPSWIPGYPQTQVRFNLIRLFTRPWPEGLNKSGLRVHPDQGLLGYTLISYVIIYGEQRMLRWQRSALPECRYPDVPEEFRFGQPS